MSFIELNPEHKVFKIIKQYFLNRDLNEKVYLIFDAGNEYTPLMTCPECEQCSFNFNTKGSYKPYEHKSNFGENKLKQYGGSGVMFKLMKCPDCANILYYGVGFDEPCNGRSQFFIHTILKIEQVELNHHRDDFYGNMGEPTCANEYFLKYGVYPPNHDGEGN